ncbi:MAG: carbamoyltransferase N-terminal domain-containing protein [Myxococcota bacterium]
MVAALGVSAHYHDAAAALVIDGEIVAAVQEERLSGRKHDPSFPRRAIAECLALGNLEGPDLDCAVFYENPYAKLERVLVSALRTFPRSYRQFPRAMAQQLSEKIWVLDRISEATGIDRRKVETVHHHHSHAAAAFFTAPYREAAVLTVDGVGEETTTAIWHGQNDVLEERLAVAFPHSLGLFYAALTAYLGFEVNEGEYKVMGLAAYGTDRFAEEFSTLLRLFDDGSFELNLPFFDSFADPTRAYGTKLTELLGPARRPGRAWDLEDPADQRYADIARSLQTRLEDAVVGLAKRARSLTQASALCLAGGVALNAVANRRVLQEAGFDRMYVQPAAGDAGGALGAAIAGAIAHGDPLPAALASPDLGLPAAAARTKGLAEELGLDVRTVSDPIFEANASIERGDIVGLCTGRGEWGPRARGFRSLLADPTTIDTRERINRRVKGREPFRPFAPATIADEAAAYYTGAPNDLTRFMTTVCEVTERGKAVAAATTHVDGSARVQTTTENSAPVLHAILEARHRAGLPPVLLNTSLNGPGEPIAADGPAALATFLSRPFDALLVEDVMIRRKR